MKRILVQPTDNQRGQDGLKLQLYVHTLTQAAFVPITGSFSVKSLNNMQPLSLCLLKNGAKWNNLLYIHTLYLFFLFPDMLLLICHSVYRREKKQKDKKAQEWGLAFWSWQKKQTKKKRGNYFQNKQLPFASQLKNNKSQKWPVAEHLNTHINHKNSYTAPWQCIATVQNFSQGERRQKNTLLLLTPASHFGLQRF